jgi:hypothetical protein
MILDLWRDDFVEARDVPIPDSFEFTAFSNEMLCIFVIFFTQQAGGIHLGTDLTSYAWFGEDIDYSNLQLTVGIGLIDVKFGFGKIL